MLRGDMQIPLVDDVRSHHLDQHPARKNRGVVVLVDLRGKDDEFIAALAAHGVGGLDAAEQTRGDGLKKLVAGRVSERIVDVLEAVDVEEEDRDLGAVALRERDRLADAIVEQQPVRQAGEDIVLGRMGDLQRHRPGGRLCLPARADVADRSSDQNAVGALQRAQHDLDRKFAAILAARRKLDAGADLLRQRLGPRARAVGDQPLGEAFRDDVGDLLAEEFVAGIAELLLGLEIEEDDLAILVHHHHRVRRRFQEPAVTSLHLRQMIFGLLADADVADRSGDQDAVGALQRAQHDLDRKFAAILAARREFDAGADLLRQRLGRWCACCR